MRDSLSRFSRLPFGILLIVLAGWAVTHSFKGWTHIQSRVTQKPVIVERPKFVVMDEQIANDPAMQATKMQPAGPMAKLLEWDQSRGSGLPEVGADPTEASATEESARTPYPPVRNPGKHRSIMPAPLQVCQGKMTIAGSRTFHFQVPSNIGRPKLTGRFTSRVRGTPQAVNLLLLDQQQYEALIGGGPETGSLHDSEASREEIDLVLSPTLEAERDYYLVFRNSSRQPVSLDAAFTVTFN